MERTELVKILSKYGLYFPQYSITEPLIKLWHEDFGSLDAYDFELALKTCINEPGRAFFPAPGEVRKHLSRFQSHEQYSPDQAWNLALEIADAMATRKEKGLTKKDIKEKYYYDFGFATKPAMTETLRSMLWRIVDTFCYEHKEYNPWGSPGRAASEVDRDKHFCELDFRQEYKTRLKDYQEKIKLGIDPHIRPLELQHDKVTPVSTKILSQLELI